jgi:hypothetical protein
MFYYYLIEKKMMGCQIQKLVALYEYGSIFPILVGILAEVNKSQPHHPIHSRATNNAKVKKLTNIK